MKLCLSFTILYLIHIQLPVEAIGYGVDAEFDEFPWHVHIETVYKELNKTLADEITVRCGGALISYKFILTARHCLNYPITSLKNITLVFRTYRYITSRKLSKINPIRIVYHPENYDIALLRLPNGLKFNALVKPIDLPPKNLNIKDVNGQKCLLSGFGKDENGKLYKSLRYAVQILDPIDYPECKMTGHICARSLRKYETANEGDFGGGLVLRNQITLEYFLIGIATETFADNITGLYVRVDQFCDWISKHTGIKVKNYDVKEYQRDDNFSFKDALIEVWTDSFEWFGKLLVALHASGIYFDGF